MSADPRKIDLARRYLAAVPLMETVVAGVLKGMVKAMNLSPQEETHARGLLQQRREVIEQAFLDVFVRTYTASELEAFVGFVTSDVGRSITAKTDVQNALIIERVVPITQAVVREIRES